MSSSQSKKTSKKNISGLLMGVVIGVILLSLFYWIQKVPQTTKSNTPPRVAVSWMRSWATAGQIMEALSRTNIPQLYNSSATFPSFLFGPEMNESALNKTVDATNTGIVPTISLLAASDDWVVVARLIDFEVATVARKGTGIKKISDLKGKSIAVPFGGGSHPYILQRLEETKLKVGDAADKVKLFSLKPPEQPLAMEKGSVDAVGTWEPQTTITVGRGYGEVVDTFRHIGFITIRKKLAEQNPQEVVNLLKAYIEANFYVVKHRDQTDKWFANTSGYELKLVKKIRVIEPNLKAQKIEDIDIDINKDDVKVTDEVADVMFRYGLIRRPIKIEKRMDMSYLQQALKELKQNGFKTSQVKIR